MGRATQADSLPHRVLAFLLGKREAATAPEAAPAAGPLSVAQVARAYFANAGLRGAAMVGKVHVLSLRAIRERMGERWPALRDRVAATAEAVLAAHLGHDSLRRQIAEDVFVLALPGVDKAEGQAHCVLLVDAIQKRLLGDAIALQEITISTYLGEHDGDPILETRDGAVILAKAARAATADAATRSPAESVPTPSDALGAPEPRSLVPEPITFAYVPMWNVRRRAVSGYHCLARHQPAASEDLQGYLILPDGENSPFVVELDLRTLKQATAALEDLKARGVRALISATVHCRTLERAAARVEFARICGALSDELRHLFILEIAGLPRDAPESRVWNAVIMAKPFCRTVVVRANLDRGFLPRAQCPGSSMLSLCLTGSTIPESMLLAQFNRFCERAERLGLQTIAHGLDSRSKIALAVGAGFNFVNGEAVSQPLANPGPMIRFALDDVYR